jgi:NTE family protein
VSDAGAPADIHLSPWKNWVGQLGRIRSIMMEQTRALRRRMVVDAIDGGRITEGLWRVSTRIADFKLPDALIDDSPATAALQCIPTRLTGLDERQQCELINWGYALCDAAMRSRLHVGARPAGWPAPGRYAFPIKALP